MYRRILPVLAAALLPTLFLVTVGSGAAEAVVNPVVLSGNVTCSTAGGVWNGLVTFSPALKNGGTSNHEEIVVKAVLGNTTSPCVTTPGFAAIGAIAGQLRFHIPGTANNCSTVFSGSALPTPTNTTAAPPRFKIKWSTPSGSAATKWKQPANFVVTGALAQTSITINGGTVERLVLLADPHPDGHPFRQQLGGGRRSRLQLGQRSRQPHTEHVQRHLVTGPDDRHLMTN